MPSKDPELNRKWKREHYHRNKEQYLARNKAKKERIYDFIVATKDVPCKDCNVKFPPECMDFDHVEDNKLYNVSGLRGFGSFKKLKEEIAKCEIVCANCHRIRTKKRLDALKGI